LEQLCVAFVVGGAQRNGPLTVAQLLREVFRSPRLGRNVAYTLYVPDLPATMSEPALVLYLLHGPGGDEKTWTGEDPMLRGPLVNAMHNGTLRPSVLVMPTVGNNSWWIDGAVDAAASAFLEEMMPNVEARLPFPVSRARRALVGVSMGGFGALHLALLQPQRFCAAALISPTVYDPLPPPDSAARRTPQFVREGKFDEQRWQAANYPARLAAYRLASQKVAFWISTGDRDQPDMLRAATQLFARLHALQPDRTELRLMPGAHSWATFDASLAPALSYIDTHCR
jgi:S-formylglutathione hydrolase FrmB